VPSTGDIRFIASNTSSSITLLTALSTVPANGAEMWLGIIPIEYRTKWWEDGGKEYKKSPSYYNLSFFPGSLTGVAQVYFYYDYNTTPYVIPADASYGNPADGVTFVSGVITINLSGGSNSDGYVPVPQPSEWNRSIQARIICQRPDGVFRLMDMDFSDLPSDVAKDQTE
jgi:hypothetical protein